MSLSPLPLEALAPLSRAADLVQTLTRATFDANADPGTEYVPGDVVEFNAPLESLAEAGAIAGRRSAENFGCNPAISVISSSTRAQRGKVATSGM